MTLDDRLKDVFADAFETTPDRIDADTSVDNAPATWDSMRSIVLASSVEAEFGITFSDTSSSLWTVSTKYAIASWQKA